jgi:hypothetical protein
VTTITQNVTDIAGMDDDTSWTFYTQEIRESDDDSAIITPKRVRKYPVSGVLTVELDPGPAIVLAPDGKRYPFTVPASDSGLWPLIQAAVTIPPTTSHQDLLDAVAAWLAVNGSTSTADEYHEYVNLAAFPGGGTADRIYVALDTGKFYRWTGSAYQLISETDIAAVTHAATGKTTPVDADEMPIVDSAASNVLKKVTFANLKAWVKSWIAKGDVGLGNVDNLQQQPLDADLTALAALTAPATKLSGIATGATANSSDATLLARANHTGTQSADTLTDGTTNKAFLATERTKLAGIATAATANSADATLLARANHTGTQLASTVSDFATATRRIAAVAIGAYVTTLQNLSSSAAGTSRVPYMAAVDCSDLRFGYVNWCPDASTQAEIDNAAFTMKAAIEVGGVVRPLTFNGLASVTVGQGGEVFSDPVAIELVAGDFFYVRTYISSGTWYPGRIAWTSGMGGWTATTDLTGLSAGSIADNTSFTVMPSPHVIVGRSKGASVIVIGDSIGYGYGDGAGGGLAGGVHTSVTKNGSQGFIGLACQTVGGLVNLGVSSDTAQKFVTSHFRRGALSRFANTAICQYGRNDLSNGRTLAQVQADVITIWNKCNLRGLRTLQTTITPVSTSTAGWTTTASQTASGNLTTRNSFNAWLRDGAPMSAGAAVATGTGGASRCQVLQGGTVVAAASGAAHPLYAVADVGSAAETTTTSGIWKAPNNLRTVTNASATSGGFQVTSTTASWTSADVGRQVTVAGAGASGALYISTISSFSGNNAFVYDAIGTTVSGATANIGDFQTVDGIHPSHEAVVAMAAQMPTAAFI